MTAISCDPDESVGDPDDSALVVGAVDERRMIAPPDERVVGPADHWLGDLPACSDGNVPEVRSTVTRFVMDLRLSPVDLGGLIWQVRPPAGTDGGHDPDRPMVGFE